MKKSLVSPKFKVIAVFLLCVLLLVSCNSEEESSTNVSEITSSDDSSADVSSEAPSAEESLAEEGSSDASKEEPSSDAESSVTGTYKGVLNYGNVTADQKDNFKYVFEVDGKQKIYTIGSDGGKYAIQNSLKRGYEYEITADGKVITAVKELTEDPDFTPVISGTPGEKTIANLLSTAMMPVGSTLYIYGGGWNWQDTGASVHATTIGLSDAWAKFFNSQKISFTYSNSNDKTNSYYPHGKWNEYYYAGLDCSGYIGWTVYNVANTESGKEGYVMSAVKMAKAFASNGWGTLKQSIASTPAAAKGTVLPGDIISKKGHVYMCVGTCDDGSMVILHSTPSDSRVGTPGGGVQLSAVGEDESCEAYALADKYMKTYYPEWYKRYPVVVKSFSEYTAFTGDMGIMSWNVESESTFMSDPDGIRSMTAEQVLEYIFKDIPTEE